MSKITFVVAIVSICVNSALGLPGSGTEADSWRIESLVDFNEFAADANYWDDWTRLETDVNLAGRTYSTAVIAPDTDSSANYFQGTAFTGVFDGNDHKIIGLTIDDGGVGNDYLGLFGYIYIGEVKNLGLEGGSVSGNWGVGGLVGWNEAGEISNCYSNADVKGIIDIGGLVGYVKNGNVSNCYSIGDVNGFDDVGGLVGLSSGIGIISNCYSTGSVSGWRYVGGLVGEHLGIVSNCYATGDVSGDWCVGGLVGINGLAGPGIPPYPDPGYIYNSYSTGAVQGNSDVGGLVGWHKLGEVSNCYSKGDVNGVEHVGGLVGWNFGSVSNCYSTSDVSGDNGVGGLVGYNYGSVSNCYSTSDVNGGDSVGGLVGVNGWEYSFGKLPGYIYTSYSTGVVEGFSNVGGLVGSNIWGDIEESFWDIETSEQLESDGGMGKTTTEMKKESTFTDAGWDFDEIWNIGEKQTYPYLRQYLSADLNHDGRVNMVDFAILAGHWLEGAGR